jgi:hypothetical protein
MFDVEKLKTLLAEMPRGQTFRIFCFLKPEIDVIDSAHAIKTLLISTEK